jgi:hypothetical protein
MEGAEVQASNPVSTNATESEVQAQASNPVSTNA